MLQENILALRRKAGLSQEQLAEQLEVTRQTISKWEGGHSVPDLEKLQAMCRVFGVTLDELTGTEPPQPRQPGKKGVQPGLLLCLIGAVGLILLGLLALAAPEQAATLDQSSMVTIRGTGLLMTASAVVLAVGAWLLLRKK
ncbi:MAG: helix-turn-helix transcriptional regulator [Clostridia bacterium]|nr:helix-turn-helix transcriptional regulator [Clostridia bacterium]